MPHDGETEQEDELDLLYVASVVGCIVFLFGLGLFLPRFLSQGSDGSDDTHVDGQSCGA